MKNDVIKPKKNILFSMLMPSVLGIVACAACLLGSTFAWFQVTQSTSVQVIQAANYYIDAIVNDGTENVWAENGTYSLEAEKEYSVIIKAGGSASVGCGIIYLGDNIFYTEPLYTQSGVQSIEFTLQINEPVDMEITARWGTMVGVDGTLLQNKGTYLYGEAEPIETTELEETTETEETTEIEETTETEVTTEVEETTESTESEEAEVPTETYEE